MASRQTEKQENRYKNIKFIVPIKHLSSALNYLNSVSRINRIALLKDGEDEYQVIFAASLFNPVDLADDLKKFTEGTSRISKP